MQAISFISSCGVQRHCEHCNWVLRGGECMAVPLVLTVSEINTTKEERGTRTASRRAVFTYQTKGPGPGPANDSVSGASTQFLKSNQSPSPRPNYKITRQYRLLLRLRFILNSHRFISLAADKTDSYMRVIHRSLNFNMKRVSCCVVIHCTCDCREVVLLRWEDVDTLVLQCCTEKVLFHLRMVTGSCRR